MGREIQSEQLRLAAGPLGASGGGTSRKNTLPWPALVVNIDLEKFFLRVNHDMLMRLVARRAGDQRVRRFISRLFDHADAV
jgi:retron-type reverse transcriptase